MDNKPSLNLARAQTRKVVQGQNALSSKPIGSVVGDDANTQYPIHRVSDPPGSIYFFPAAIG